METQELMRAVHSVEERLIDEFGDRVSREEIERRTLASLNEYRDARIMTFVPIFIQREVREQLRAQ